MRPTAYICGPYSGDTEQRDYNIRSADAVGRAIFLLGYDVFIPHNNTARWDDDPRFDGAYERFMEMCLAEVARRDVLVLAPGWRESPGSLREKDAATGWGKPVLHSYSDAQAWIKEWEG